MIYVCLKHHLEDLNNLDMAENCKLECTHYVSSDVCYKLFYFLDIHQFQNDQLTRINAVF